MPSELCYTEHALKLIASLVSSKHRISVNNKLMVLVEVLSKTKCLGLTAQLQQIEHLSFIFSFKYSRTLQM